MWIMDEGTIQFNETTTTPTSAGGPSPGLKRHADHQESNADSAQKPILEFSSVLGRPSIILDPEDVMNLPRPFPNSGLHIRAIDGHTLVKFGKHIRLQEAEAMKFVSENTDIACPEVQSAYLIDGVGYIIMSWEDATPLQLFWEQATQTERNAVITKLSLHVAQMRTFKGDYVGGFGRNACVNDEFNWDFHREEGHGYGPYEDETAFNEGLIQAMDRSSPSPKPTDPESRGYNKMFQIDELVKSLRGHEIVFTHGDLHAANILVGKDLRIVIVDWSDAGFYPDYWEFYKATWMGTFEPSFIRQIVKFIPPYWIEANIMRQIYDIILG